MMRRTEVPRGFREMEFDEGYDRYRRGWLSLAGAAEWLGVSERTFRRWRGRYDSEGLAGLLDRRLGKVSPHRIAADEVARIVALYRDRHAGWSARHFHDRARERHGLAASYGWTRSRAACVRFGSGGAPARGGTRPEIAGIVSTDSYGVEITQSVVNKIAQWQNEDTFLWNNAPLATSAPGASSGDLEIARLYQAALDRQPDQAGLTSWRNAFGGGTPDTDVAHQVLASVEYQARFGDAFGESTSSYVTSLYHNVLQRAPDAAGLAAWQAQIDNNILTREQVLIDFAVSTENVADTSYLATLHQLGNGAWSL